ncbi:peroxidasin homolog isoform X1 [Folsomia candida]|uniref:peroxidasin homolog isoform X1 n=1 Tax=Folsomia candida TaxID=158441 RepID=UPI000B8FA0CE|nr:peroxidasin homolog isoform X1 [Folsomia candida]
MKQLSVNILLCIIGINWNFLQSARATTTQCPMRCLCFRTTVRCMFLNLDKIPQVPLDTTVLDLRFNRIREIAPFQFRNLSDLTTLLLNNNQIIELKNGAFQGLSQLQHLYIYKNRIRHLDSDVFTGLPKLEQLYLHYNYIPVIEPTMFHQLTNLKRLFLQNNKIQKIPVGSFDNLENLQRLRLDGNALVCDCGMMSFAQMLASHKETIAAAICEQPFDMKGKSVLMLTGSMENHCREPILLEEPRDIDVKFGNTVYFRCRAEFFGRNPKIVWLQNNNEINTQLPPRYSIMNDGTLMIENIEYDDLGTFECIARSEGGEVKSRKAHANAETLVEYKTTQQQRPRFLKMPMDQEVVEGKDLLLNCSASGPSTTITWYYNEKPIDFSAPNNEITDEGLRIQNVTRERNEGVYKCSALNLAGNISAVAQIKVLASIIPPTWLVTPSEAQRIVELGEKVVLFCEATGKPVPKISWFHNGALLPQKGNLLEITAAVQESHGEYTCRADNGEIIETVTNIKIVSGSTPVFTHNLTNLPTRLRPGIQLQLPCSAVGRPTASIIWRKNLETVLETLRIAILPSGTLIINEFDPDEDSGTYQCSAFNDHGFISSKQIVIDRNQLAVRQDSDSDIVSNAYNQARHEVESAENETLRILSDTSKNEVLSPVELLRLTRFPRGEGRFIARPAEIYERALSLIKSQLEKGMSINVTKDFSYDDLLTTSQLETLGSLSGCISHRRMNFSCNQDKCFNRKYRTIDGTCNNPSQIMWGASYTPFQRLLTSQYENAFNLPKGWTASKQYNGYTLPDARVVTNKIITTDSISPDSNYTHMLMQWGQFLDHDLDHALPSLSIESFGERVSCRRTCENVAPCFPMQAPTGDVRIRTRKCMEFTRSAGVCGSGVTSILFESLQQREQINQLTSYIDASQVYGSSEIELTALRSITEPIYLRNGIFMFPNKPLMPFATDDNFVDCRRNFRMSDVPCFVGGDIRVNEQVGLLAMHTIWFRQHNFVAQKLRDANPRWRNETVFQEARKIVGAQMQHISYVEWLPKIVGSLGMAELGPYRGYNPKINPSITNAFATAAMRFGHTLINPSLRRLDGNFETIREGDIPLRQAFFAPWRLVEEGGVDPLMRGLFDTPAKLRKSTEFLNSHLTNDLFGHAHLVALDLASMNIQRSRDHGLPSYNDYRAHCGLTKATSFDDLKFEIPDKELRNKLQQVYGHVSNIDLWVGGIAEQPSSADARVGPTFRCILLDQFRRLRDGDRFWYENEEINSKEQIREIKRTTLARVLCDTGDALSHVRKDVFSMISNIVNCKLVQGMNLELWTTEDDIICRTSRRARRARISRSG